MPKAEPQKAEAKSFIVDGELSDELSEVLTLSELLADRQFVSSNSSPEERIPSLSKMEIDVVVKVLDARFQALNVLLTKRQIKQYAEYLLLYLFLGIPAQMAIDSKSLHDVLFNSDQVITDGHLVIGFVIFALIFFISQVNSFKDGTRAHNLIGKIRGSEKLSIGDLKYIRKTLSEIKNYDDLASDVLNDVAEISKKLEKMLDF